MLQDLPEKKLIDKLNKQYKKINSYRGPQLKPAFDNAYFVVNEDGKKFLVGVDSSFEANRVYGKDEAHNEEGSSPHAASYSWTFAVMIYNDRLTDVAVEIRANSYDKHITDYSCSMMANSVKINGELKSEYPAKTSIGIMQHDGKEHSFTEVNCSGFYNVADRRRIVDVLTNKDGKNKSFGICVMPSPSSFPERFSGVNTPVEMAEVCKDLIVSTKRDSEMAQDYRHYLNTKKITAQRQAINEIGGSTSKPRFGLTKMWLNFRSNQIAKGK